MTRPEVGLRPIDAGNWEQALAVRVTEEQLPLVAGHQPVALVILAKAYLRLADRRWTPLALHLPEEGVVGVVALADRDGTCEVLHLVVDEQHQGRGIGTAALGALQGYARTVLGCERLELTVHPGNVVAQRLYRAVGYAPTGEQRHGEQVWVLGDVTEPAVG